ncbi:hypothetical protein LEP1GSC049_2311 [Leptospira kirschneri serovar Cynopteri str. 3522 CT]|uniref:Uncharacterized protein n=2 Tax=Leptospira kirschneri TaxID=29507 RepID=A0A0E2BCB2_9LEPT|nr:hypothetical protein LEP1GSC044_2302 [Leptospira kirschneri serovar Grippotyphosa str. RM52]EKO14801.1 hypothetical protein LEP1GSC081_1675 [Leptospira kirschneri str. H1]EKO61323.1 hypothetical protein LEP1GSC082_2782 [Leptospira kirschneri str. H2]EKP03542.1 hypothetical protein LEP1GSC018_3070 [Leptospira kirschneri str. 2008720114]EKQ81942.1 hypothetical protein LEP1GSC064_0191 [Leptospira kirschneri serovar Grippotyphosa str. Moskva]EKR09788.1 hypothetical protein LEP1GSC122_3211 [Lept
MIVSGLFQNLRTNRSVPTKTVVLYEFLQSLRPYKFNSNLY